MAGMLAAGCGRVDTAQVKVSPVTAEELKQAVSNASAKVVLVNLWATWCGPCREEFPDLLRLEREYRGRGLKVFLVSADFENELPVVKRFLARQGVTFPTYFKAQKDMEFINGLEPRWSGALPATLLYDSTGRLRDFWEGKATYAMFRQKVESIMEEHK
jgi:thiol-disulfide isomerase/thioredoxin